ncbi:MAG: GNAT family N-acetyltransferase [Gemmataceae bacterium]
MHIRIATSLDQDVIHDIYSTAFAEGEREIVSTLAINLLSEETTPNTISSVAEIEGVVVGHVAFSPVRIGTDESWRGYILAPLAVKPDYQNRRVGSKLIENGIGQLSRMDVDILFVYGDPGYYGRFGFSVDAAVRYTPPYELQFPFGWQGLALTDSRTESSAVRITCVNSLCDPKLW